MNPFKRVDLESFGVLKCYSWIGNKELTRMINNQLAGDLL